MNLFFDLTILLFLGICGWKLFCLLHLPVPSMLGPITIITIFRSLGYVIPTSPEFLGPLVQITLGLIVGSKVTKDTIRGMGSLVFPASLIALWAIGVVFLLGSFLTKVTSLDPYTALLASSMGGLPEMTVIALATDADVAVVIVMQTFRLVATATTFPIIFRFFVKNETALEPVVPIKITTSEETPKPSSELLRLILSLVIASIGGMLFLHLGVPAGAMVGSLIFVIIASLGGVPIKQPSPLAFEIMIVVLGIVISDNINEATFVTLLSGNLLLPIIFSTVLTFSSSFLIAYVIFRTTSLDFPTSFLAAAPGGFTVMTSYAIKYDRNPLSVSMLHLCRLLALKTVIPFVFLVWGS